MGSPQDNQLKQSLGITNNMFVAEENVCTGTCTAVTDNTTIVISDTTIFGGVTVKSQCTANVACVMNNQLSLQVKDIMSAAAQQSQTTESNFFLSKISGQSNSADQSLNINNNITNIMTNTCQANSSSLTANTNVLITGSTIDGSVVVGSSGNAQADCTMNNVSNIVVYNQQQATADQSQRQYNTFAIIAIAIVIGLIVFAVIIFLVLFLRSSKYRTNYVNPGTNNGQVSQPSINIVTPNLDDQGLPPLSGNGLGNGLDNGDQGLPPLSNGLGNGLGSGDQGLPPLSSGSEGS